MLLKFYLPYCQYYTVVNLDVNSFENYITNCILLELNNSLLLSVRFINKFMNCFYCVYSQWSL